MFAAQDKLMLKLVLLRHKPIVVHLTVTFYCLFVLLLGEIKIIFEV